MHVRKITVTGASKSYSLTLPKDIIRKLKWRKGQRVNIAMEGKKIIIADWKKDQ